LQNPPEEIPKLLDALEEGGYDLVYGRYSTKEHRAWRNLGSAVTNGFYRLVVRHDITGTPFRALRRPPLGRLLTYTPNFTFIDGLLAWNTQRIGDVPVKHRPRAAGRSGYSLAKLTMLALNLFTNFSLLPLQLVTVVGVVTACLGILTGLYYLEQYSVSQITVPGYASIIIAVLVLGGLQMLSLGILGEYLGRVHLNVNRKPQYTVRNVRGSARARRPAA